MQSRHLERKPCLAFQTLYPGGQVSSLQAAMNLGEDLADHRPGLFDCRDRDLLCRNNNPARDRGQCRHVVQKEFIEFIRCKQPSPLRVSLYGLSLYGIFDNPQLIEDEIDGLASYSFIFNAVVVVEERTDWSMTSVSDIHTVNRQAGLRSPPRQRSDHSI